MPPAVYHATCSASACRSAFAALTAAWRCRSRTAPRCRQAASARSQPSGPCMRRAAAVRVQVRQDDRFTMQAQHSALPSTVRFSCVRCVPRTRKPSCTTCGQCALLQAVAPLPRRPAPLPPPVSHGRALRVHVRHRARHAAKDVQRRGLLQQVVVARQQVQQVAGAEVQQEEAVSLATPGARKGHCVQPQHIGVALEARLGEGGDTRQTVRLAAAIQQRSAGVIMQRPCWSSYLQRNTAQTGTAPLLVCLLLTPAYVPAAPVAQLP